jgi:hypothetical protein
MLRMTPSTARGEESFIARRPSPVGERVDAEQTGEGMMVVGEILWFQRIFVEASRLALDPHPSRPATPSPSGRRNF